MKLAGNASVIWLRAGNYVPVLERLPQQLQHITRELRQFIPKTRTPSATAASAAFSARHQQVRDSPGEGMAIIPEYRCRTFKAS